MELFGYQIKKAKKDKEIDEKVKSFVPPADEVDGGFSIDAGGHFGQYYDISGQNYKNEIELILKYRQIALLPEVDAAIEDIVAESIVSDEDSAPVELTVEDVDLPDTVKKKLIEEFEEVVELVNFNWYGHDIFRRWYVDGRLYYHKVIDEKNTKNGIVEIRPIDPTKLRRIKESVKSKDEKTGAEIITGFEEYYIYTPQGPSQQGRSGLSISSPTTSGIKITKEAICFVSSGLLDPSRSMVIGPLHKTLKVAQQLSMLEDALVIYRLARAPERRIFYIDVGNLPKGKAEEYVNGIMSRYRNKMTYDATTGELRDDKRHMSMLEDFWLPRREGGRGTEISTLPGGENLGQIDDLIYFMKKMYKSMGVPSSRLSSEDAPMVSLGRAGEISREELKYQKFIGRMRKKFSYLFLDLLRDQVILKGILTPEEWEVVSQDIAVDYKKDNHFAELFETDLMKERLSTLREMEEYVGVYFSREWVRKNILRQTDEDIEIMDKQIKDEPENDDVEYESKNHNLDSQILGVLKEESQTRLLDSLNNLMEQDDTSDEDVINNIKALYSLNG